MGYKNIEDKRVNEKRYRDKNKEKIKAMGRKHYANNKEKILTRKKLNYEPEKQKEYYLQNRDKIKSRVRIYASKHQEHIKGKRDSIEYRLKAIKSRSKKLGMDFDLTIGWIKSLPLICYYTGMQLTLESNFPNTISFDRIDSNKDYTQDNVVLCMVDINYAKNDLSKDNFIQMCRDVILWQDRDQIS